MRLNPGIAAGVLLATAAGAFAQYPSQYPTTYPPGQYPPTTYPPTNSPYPNTYPYPNNYPYPNTYPMPGGVPIGLPVPEIKLPKKKDKNEKTSPAQEQVRVVSVDGTLRRMREKDLLLETRKSVLRFRLLAKTRFENKSGDPVRDSLLHPGDQLSVQVSPDDLETALHVVLLHPGSGSERASAEKPVPDTSIRAPEEGDFGKSRTVAVSRDSADSSSPAPAIEEDARPAAPPDTAPEPDKLSPSGPKGAADDDIIAGARTAAATFTTTLPNYLVEQVTSRYFSPSPAPRWRLIDEVTADLAYVDGKEDYRNFRINGDAIDRPEKSGSWSTGEFSTTLEDLLSLPTNAHFRRRGEQRMAGRNAIVFDYTVAQTNSHWTVVSPDDRRYNPPYEGAIWVDRDTRRILRIEQRTTSMPAGWPFSGVESALDYGYFRIEDKTYLLPARAENKSCMSGSGACTRNVIEFRNYRKFTAESNVKFGQ